ncbi:hypothetical protein QFC20_005041 [Naganishia adeliensis]|uniref:Uncharacterized protein n=1 Tax=Naganishia adeliensis TaxID=92952 RepID=A0ACC2VUV1_9TREE|nr:hypothetical protein QFC20_005041 [Naganishia adeliensis]
MDAAPRRSSVHQLSCNLERWYHLSQELYYTNRKPTDIWVPPIPTHHPNRNAIVTSVFTPDRALSAAVLGHSISRYSNAASIEEGGELAEQCKNVDMVLIYLPGAVESEERRKLEQVGWTLVPVEPVYGPKDAAEPYTKFRAFDFTQYAHILMLDSDTLVVSQDVYRIFDLDLDFAGVTNQYTDRQFHQPIDTGVLYFRPGEDLARFVLSRVNSSDYPHGEGEQSLVRTFLKHATTHLPIEWNVSLKGKPAWRGEWAILRPRFKILHYTHPKPFLHDARDFVGTIWAE